MVSNSIDEITLKCISACSLINILSNEIKSLLKLEVIYTLSCFLFFLQLKAIMTDEVNNLQPVEITTWDQYLLSQEVITLTKRTPQCNMFEFPSIPRQRSLISIPGKSPNLKKT